MAINNVYNQTPKRIFTNKPFIKGMAYTNAGMSPYVCRSMANIDLESSGTATKVRQGIQNKRIALDGQDVYNDVLKFYNKFILIPNIITLPLYQNGIVPTSTNTSNTKIKLVSEDTGNVYDFYNYIVYNDTQVNFNNETLSHKGPVLGQLNSYNVHVLKLNDGSIPHIINANDMSISFFGLISSSSSGVYAYHGLIKIYFHNSAKKAILEIVQPSIVAPEDIMNYGSNILSDNPLIYKDHVYFNAEHDGYLDYASADSNGVIDITTVQVYDKAVAPVEYVADSDANLVKGFDKNEEDSYVYVRPFPVLPKGNYVAVLGVNSTNEDHNTFYYNFSSDTFNPDVIVDKLVPSTVMDANMSYVADGVSSYEPNISLDGINLMMSVDAPTSETGKGYIEIFDTTYHSMVTNNSLDNIYTSEKLLEMSGKGLIKLPETNLPNRIRVASRTKIEIPHENYEIPLPVSIDPANPTVLNITPKVYRTNTFYRNDSGIGDVDLDYNEALNAYGFLNMTLGYHMSTTRREVLYGISLADYKSKLKFIADEEFESSNVSYGFWKSMYSDDGTRELFRVLILTSWTEAGVTVESEITILSDNFTEAEKVKTFTLMYGRIYDCVYPFAQITEEISAEDAGVSIGYEFYMRSTELIARPYIKIDQDKQPICPIDMLFSTFHNNDEHIDVVNPELGLETSIDVLQYIYGIYKGARYADISLNFPKMVLTEYTTKSSIGAAYTRPIQTIDELGNLISDYNLPVLKTSLNSVPGLTDSGVVIFKVTIYPASSDEIYDDADSVSMPSATIKTYMNDILRYDNLSKETNYKPGVDHIGMHLGHYVFWGSGTKSNTLYYSEFNNPAYIPSMYAIDFNNPIVHVHPHQSNLVVFTTDDIYLLHNGNVPSTILTDGSEMAFTQSLIQANTRLGYNNANTVVSIGKDVFFISDSGDGYLLKTNRYVSDSSDTYLVKITHQIEDLMKNPYSYVIDRGNDYGFIFSQSRAKPLDFFPWGPVKLPTSDELESSGFEELVVSPDAIRVIDGDTFETNGVTYRLADINTPELSTNARLAVTAKNVLQSLIQNSSEIHIYYRNGVVDEYYGRQLAWVTNSTEYLNAHLVRLGLAELYFENEFSSSLNIANKMIDLSRTNAAALVRDAADDAIRYNRGIHNNLVYTEGAFASGSSNTINKDEFTSSLYTYATNSYINIIQSIAMAGGQGFTIIYKYNIDARTWSTYDFIGCAYPTKVVPDNTKTGYYMLCNNAPKTFRQPTCSKLVFTNSFVDHNEVAEYLGNIHAHFDTGNQAIAIMNEKLFREFKLSLGSSDTSNLNIQYKIRMFVDGTEITNKDKHFRGKQETTNGFKKITFFAPSRGRIPRYTVDITCDSDVNILEYAIVYLQLNAK